VSPTGTVAATAVFDAFGVKRHGTGALAPAAVREAYGSDEFDGVRSFLGGRAVLAKAPRYTEQGCHIIHSGWVDKCGKAFEACMAMIGIPIGLALACVAACFNPEPVLTKTLCALCFVGAGSGAGATAWGCYRRFRDCRDRADRWMIRCLQQARSR
ncbi:MAG: hypothetical protein SNJ82_11850, partial [Gemmataceae bacterium]